jgi:hypothetical protein
MPKKRLSEQGHNAPAWQTSDAAGLLVCGEREPCYRLMITDFFCPGRNQNLVLSFYTPPLNSIGSITS